MFRQYRRELGLSQSQMGKLLGVHPMTIYKWERRIRTPIKTVEILIRLLLYLKEEHPKVFRQWLRKEYPNRGE